MPGRSVVDVMEQLLRDWESAKEPKDVREAKLEIQMPVRCCAEKAGVLPPLSHELPDDLKEFWGAFSYAKLFEDVIYGQSGLVLLGYEMSNQHTRAFNRERSRDVRRGDRVIGTFIGDEDLLLIRCNSRESDSGSILVALRDGWRNEWHTAATSLSSFLEEYALYEGQKYWTPQFRPRGENMQ